MSLNADKHTIIHIAPFPHIIKGGIASYINGMINSNLSNEFTFNFLDVTVPDKKKKGIKRIGLSIYFTINLVLLFFKSNAGIYHVHIASGQSLYEKTLFLLLVNIAGKKSIAHWHNAKLIDQIKGSTFYRRVFQFSSRLANKNIVLSNNWIEYLKEISPKSNFILIENAIDTSSFRKDDEKLDNSTIRILFVGWIGERKGLRIIGNAISNLIKNGIRNFHLDLLGTEEFAGDYNNIIKYFNDKNIASYATFHGVINGVEKSDYFSKADIFILPSYNESFGLVNLEAMASGLPIISTKVGAIPEYLNHGENGFLIDPGDSERLSEYLSVLIKNFQLRLKMGNLNYSKVRNIFDWKIISTKIRNLYLSLL